MKWRIGKENRVPSIPRRITEFEVELVGDMMIIDTFHAKLIALEVLVLQECSEQGLEIAKEHL